MRRLQSTPYNAQPPAPENPNASVEFASPNAPYYAMRDRLLSLLPEAVAGPPAESLSNPSMESYIQSLQGNTPEVPRPIASQTPQYPRFRPTTPQGLAQQTPRIPLARRELQAPYTNDTSRSGSTAMRANEMADFQSPYLLGPSVVGVRGGRPAAPPVAAPAKPPITLGMIPGGGR